MEKIELPENFKNSGLYEIIIIEDKKGTFIKCGKLKQLQNTYISVKLINNQYAYNEVKDEIIVKYLDNKYGTNNISNIVY